MLLHILFLDNNKTFNSLHCIVHNETQQTTTKSKCTNKHFEHKFIQKIRSLYVKFSMYGAFLYGLFLDFPVERLL